MNKKDNGEKLLKHWQVVTIWLIIYDVLAANGAYFLGLWVRFDCSYSKIPNNYFFAFAKMLPVYAIFVVAIFWLLKLYSSIWRFASYTELSRIIKGTVVTGLFHSIVITLLFERMPISYYIFGVVFQFIFVVSIRFAYRFVLLERSKVRSDSLPHVMIVGAGNAGQMLVRDINRASEVELKVCCFIDDNKNKWGRTLEGVPVYGGRDDIFSAVEKFEIKQILVALPSASPTEIRDILNICKETGCELKSLPGMYQFVNGDVSLGKMKNVSVEDLLGREPIKVSMEEIFISIKGKTILVTGGGGSIGSELCRQIAGHNPGHLIIFDIYENNAYEIQQELRRKLPDLKLTVLIGSVRDSRRINSIFEKYKPDIVYHAAAHKHVPLMEDSPCESIKNNVMGTYKTALAALRNNCSRFVLISTDKAVNPTNIMGASKRLCEMVIQSMDVISRKDKIDELPFMHAHFDEEEEAKISKYFKGEKADIIGDAKDKPNKARTEFVAVRFGNVLGSNGSVIPLFKKQIEAGGPVTVTHPDIIRYFMTIPEAVSLVLQAGTYAKGGEIFVLDMGEPVKIDELARNLIKLSGYKPDEDIDVVYTGLRPGEKLYEEKLMAEEGIAKTKNDLIHIGKPIKMNIETFLRDLEELAEASYNNSEEIYEMVKSMVTTFHSAGEK